MEKFDLIGNIRDYFSITPYDDIIEWSKKNINFSDDVSAERNYLDLQLTPHLVQPIQACGDWKNKIKEVTVVGIEQHGKSLIWEIALLYSMIYFPSQSLVVYPSDEMAIASNQTKLQPLMKHIPQLKKELERPRAFRSDRYAFSNLISYFSGSGSKVISKSCKVRIADEVDSWVSLPRVNNIEQLRKRGRSFSESLFLKVCTPTVETGKIWKQFLKGSQGYWTLYCDQCGDWTMRSCDLHNLQFESEFNEELREHIVTPGSCVLVCPKCGAQHTESEKKFMNCSGKYIHKLPDRIEYNPSFQFGCLCSLFPFMTWERIANKILESGKRSDIEAHIELDGSWKGLPYKRREVVKQDFERLKEHCWKLAEAPSMQNVEMVFLIADTQDNRSVVGIFGMDVNDNLFLIEAKEVQYLMLPDDQRSVINSSRDIPVETVQDMLNKEYLCVNGIGIKPTFGLIDRQGHRSNEIEYFAKKHPQIIMYQGTRMEQQNWKFSDNIKRLILVSAKHYQVSLIYYLYSQKKRGANYLYFMPDIADEVIKQIVCVKPDSSKKFGDAPENWQPQNGSQHDWFDVCKMAYVAIDFAIQNMAKSRWRFCKSPALMRHFERTVRKPEIRSEDENDVEKVLKDSWLKL